MKRFVAPPLWPPPPPPEYIEVYSGERGAYSPPLSGIFSSLSPYLSSIFSLNEATAPRTRLASDSASAPTPANGVELVYSGVLGSYVIRLSISRRIASNFTRSSISRVIWTFNRSSSATFPSRFARPISPETRSVSFVLVSILRTFSVISAFTAPNSLVNFRLPCFSIRAIIASTQFKGLRVFRISSTISLGDIGVSSG